MRKEVVLEEVLDDYSASLKLVDKLKKYDFRGLQVRLFSKTSSYEVVHHKLFKGFDISFVPTETVTQFDSFILVSGRMVYREGTEQIIVSEGFTFDGNNLTSPITLHAIEDSEFLYVSSNPFFDDYIKNSLSMQDLAVQIEQKDGYTSSHCQEIKRLSLMLGEELGLNSQELHILSFGSFFHDIGKIRIPNEILNKPSKLDAKEWEIMKLHTIFGAQILQEHADIHVRNASFIVEQHHERWDGLGYPYGLKGSQISIQAAIVSVVDSYDAMTSDRVYQKGRSKQEAIEELIRNKEKMYNPVVVEAFLRIIDKL